MWMQKLAVSVMFILIVSGCATKTFNPRPMAEVPFKDRAQTQSEDGVRVTVAVLSAAECKELFGLDLYKRDIQPIWIEIENNYKKMLAFLPYGVDPDYFSPLEIPYMFRSGFSKAARNEMDQYFHGNQMEIWIAPGAVRSGFVLTNLNEGTKAFNVDVMGEDHGLRTFTFFVPVPGLPISHHEVDLESLYPNKKIAAFNAAGLRQALESLPCCTINKEGTQQGEPINLVLIGEVDDVHGALLRSGWEETAALSEPSATKKSTYSGSSRTYRYAAVSPLYVYGRHQDAALQKSRVMFPGQIQLRAWLAPITFKGQEVWICQISRQVGVRTSVKGKKVTTFKIDPDVDEAREQLLQDLYFSQALLKYGYVKGVGSVTIQEPRKNLRGDPYFTDGYRLVVWLSGKAVSLDDVEFVEWALPPER
jgi:hypothetical protein